MKNSSYAIGSAVALAFAAVILGCKDPDTKAGWMSVAKACAVSDLNGTKVLFFGPSNVLGPGSIWREASAADGGGYRVRWDSNALPAEPKWSKGGGEFACQGSKKTSFSGGATAGFASDLAPLSADIKADFAKAKNVEVKASMMKWDLLLEGPFEEAVLGLPSNSLVKQDLAKPGRLVLYRALKVSGFEAKLTFDNSTSGDLKAKYTGGALKAVNGELGVGMNMKWTSANELEISAPSDFYIAGELVKFAAGGGFAASGKSPFSPPIDVAADAKLGVDTVK